MAQDSNGQFMISYELLCLLQWLIEHEADTFKTLIEMAFASGFRESMTETEKNISSIEDMQYNIIDFFTMLETQMIEVTNERAMQDALEKNLMPAIDHIDSTVCDDATVRFSVEKTTSQLKDKPQDNAQETLYKELLKRWKPTDKKVVN